MHLLNIILIMTLTLVYCDCTEYELDIVNKVNIWGPGLHPEEIIMPARYFFIDTGTNYETIEPYIPIFNVHISGLNKHNINCRIWTNILDRKDGTFIIRYKLYEICHKFRIDITHKSKHIPGSPFLFNKPVLIEECNCPREDWFREFGCKGNYKQIEDDLQPFSQVNFTELRPRILDLYHKPASHSICNYVIVKNKIYRKCYGKYVGFNMFMDSILLSLTRKLHLPDTELFVNLGDWPLSQHRHQNPLPIFSWCGSDDSYDIIMPTYDVTESTLENMGRVMLDMLSVQGNIKDTWDKKVPKVFWRGRDSNRRRLELIEISRKYPDLFNVSLTNFFFFQNEIEKYGPKSEHVSFFSFFDYKYQLNLDGTVAAYRFPYLLAGDSLILKQDSKYYEWFYKSLKPNYHYLQINEDLSNLIEQIQWASEHDDQAHEIALRGQQFAREHLMPHDIFCYYASLLTKWGERVVSEVKVLEDMEFVAQPKSNADCDCEINNYKDEL